MKTNITPRSLISHSLKWCLSFLVIFTFMFSFSSSVQARILFQDDTFHDILSPSILLDSDGTGIVNTGIQFGNDSISTENGNLQWDITNNEFDFDHTINVTGGITANGDVDFTTADSVHIQESTDPALLVGCAITGEIILDTTDNQIQVCTATGTNSVQASGSVVVTAGTGGDTYQVTVGANTGTVVNFTTDLATTAGLIANDITNNVTGFSAVAVGTTVTVTADLGGVAGNGTVSTAVTGTATTTDTNTTGGVNATATWVGLSASDATTLDTLDSLQFLRSDVADVYGSGAGAETLTIGDGTNADSLAFATNSVFDASASAKMVIRTEASAPVSCTEGEVYYDVTVNQLFICTATNTWATSGPQDFESVYATDADNTLTASGAFNVSTTGALGLDSTASSNLTVTGNSSGTETLTLSATNAGAGAGNVDVTATDDVNITATGGEITFDDATITGIVTLADTATDWDVTFAGNGIIDNINSFASTASGEGASNIGINDAGAYFAGTTVESALQDLGAGLAKNYANLLFYPEFPDAVIAPSGASSKGKMQTAVDGTEGAYYRWTTRRNTDQTMDIKMRVSLPTDFTTAGDFTLRYRTDTAVVASQNSVALAINDSAGTSCGTSAAVASTTFATSTITAATIAGSGCTLSAGSYIEVVVTVMANNTSSGGADVGRVQFLYTK